MKTVYNFTSNSKAPCVSTGCPLDCLSDQ